MSYTVPTTDSTSWEAAQDTDPALDQEGAFDGSYTVPTTDSSAEDAVRDTNPYIDQEATDEEVQDLLADNPNYSTISDDTPESWETTTTDNSGSNEPVNQPDEGGQQSQTGPTVPTVIRQQGTDTRTVAVALAAFALAVIGGKQLTGGGA